MAAPEPDVHLDRDLTDAIGESGAACSSALRGGMLIHGAILIRWLSGEGVEGCRAVRPPEVAKSVNLDG